MSDQDATIFILAGGFMKKTPDGGRAFYRAIVGERKTANVLICCFALPSDEWDSAFDDDRRSFSMFNEEVVLFFEKASPEGFIDQLSWADIVVFRGGSTQNLITSLRKIPGWETKLSGKTIVGSSAGAYMLCARYVATNAEAQLAPGLGILPALIATHYRSTFIHNGDTVASHSFWETVDALMESEAAGRIIVTLKEGEFLVLTEKDLKRPSE